MLYCVAFNICTFFEKIMVLLGLWSTWRGHYCSGLNHDFPKLFPVHSIMPTEFRPEELTVIGGSSSYSSSPSIMSVTSWFTKFTLNYYFVFIARNLVYSTLFFIYLKIKQSDSVQYSPYSSNATKQNRY